jgi:hypothetical protein
MRKMNKSGNKIYFTKDHDRVRRAANDFIEAEY